MLISLKPANISVFPILFEVTLTLLITQASNLEAFLIPGIYFIAIFHDSIICVFLFFISLLLLFLSGNHNLLSYYNSLLAKDTAFKFSHPLISSH